MTALRPTKQKGFIKNIFGFDIETYDNNKKFLLGSIYHKNAKYRKTFLDKYKLIDYLKSSIFKNSYVCATNLSFDFYGTFFDTDDMINFIPQWRGSDLIFSRAYITSDGFSQKRKTKSDKTITFIDTMNYAKLGVKNIGKILSINKLKTPSYIGKYPKNEAEKEYMIKYNMRDSEISSKFIEFLFNGFLELGATPKNTIASTSMSLFKNKYLDDIYYTHSEKYLLDELLAYYGGRTEAFKRGYIKDYNYYDFNSLYPSVMLNSFPDPNSIRYIKNSDITYIESYEGISEVDIFCPYMDIPLLPFRTDKKLLFPCGSFRGWYSHIELKKALSIGYVIKDIHQTYYFKDECRPFYNFVTDLYKKRQEYKKDNSNMEKIVKLLLNSLYGKFAQKFTDRDNWIPLPDNLSDLDKYDYIERHGNYIRVKNNMTRPASFCVPIWSLYTTAYGRLKLYDILTRCDPVYCDTDSIITKKVYNDVTALGGLKKEMNIKNGIIVKPKFYALTDYDNKGYVKIKGIGTRLNIGRFMDFIKNPSISYQKFMRFKESMRRGFIPNEIQDISKTMTLQDDKRLWEHDFNHKELQTSRPITLKDGKLYKSDNILNNNEKIIKINA